MYILDFGSSKTKQPKASGGTDTLLQALFAEYPIFIP